MKQRICLFFTLSLLWYVECVPVAEPPPPCTIAEICGRDQPLPPTSEETTPPETEPEPAPPKPDPAPPTTVNSYFLFITTAQWFLIH